MENDVKIIESNDELITVELSRGIKVKFNLGEENTDGEMEVEYDENIMTSEEVSKIVNEYLATLVEFIKNHEDKIIKESNND